MSPSSLNPQKLRIVYFLFFLVVAIELSNLLFKYYGNRYYFNVYTLGAESLVLFLMGWYLRINRIFIILFAILSLGLVALAYFIVWN
ncbi:MAG: hypothetical protein AAFU64_07895 [Bacteroidota bacterium]